MEKNWVNFTQITSLIVLAVVLILQFFAMRVRPSSTPFDSFVKRVRPLLPLAAMAMAGFFIGLLTIYGLPSFFSVDIPTSENSHLNFATSSSYPRDVVLTPTLPVNPKFSEDFSNGFRREWAFRKGVKENWFGINGVLTSKDGSCTLIAIGNEGWVNYAVDVDFISDTEVASYPPTARIIFALEDTNKETDQFEYDILDFSYDSSLWNNIRLYLQDDQKNSFPIIPYEVAKLKKKEDPRRIHVEVREKSVIVAVDGEELYNIDLSYQPLSLSGPLGLEFCAFRRVPFDNFSISELP